MHNKKYNDYNIDDNKNEGKKRIPKENPKKRNKHWRSNSKDKRVDSPNNLNMDEELLRMQNLVICQTCNNIFHNSLEKCPYC
jgi:rubrerythrin